MNFTALWEQGKTYWRAVWAAYVGDVRRIDAVSRATAGSVVFLGVLSGLVPLGVLVIVFRLTDALVGARAVRVQTSDLHQALVTAGVVWLLIALLTVGRELLQGIAARVTERTALLVLPVSLLVCTFAVMPFRAIVFTLLILVAEAWQYDRRVRIASTIVFMFAGLTSIATVVGYILSRSITVGSFLMFAGIIAALIHWFVLRRITTSRV